MAFDATEGGSSANSYCTVDFADAYFLTRLNGSWWAALTTAEKQAYLVTSTAVLEASFTWRGDPETTTQALHFPAEGYDCTNTAFTSGEVPEAVKKAVCEQANYYHGIDATEKPVAVLQGIESAKVGSLAVTFDKLNTPGKVGGMAQLLLKCYYTGVMGTSDGGSILVTRM